MEVREARTPQEVREALELRFRVFCEEQGVALSAEQDGRDHDAIHLVAVEDGRVVGTCRLLLDRGVARLGRNAVAAADRRRGIGGALLRAADRVAAQRGAERIRLHAQLSARRLYERAGYVSQGEVFLEEGIEHLTMEKRVA
jgi:predicted GNAT family N-acyltransferase